MSDATFKQGAHTLAVIGQQNPTSAHLATLHDGYLTDLVQAIVEGSIPSREEYRKLLGLTPLELKIIVDYDMTLDQMIAAGRYDWVNDDITAKRFPLTGKGTHEIVVELIHFNRNISSEEAVAELDKMGFRPGTIEELLALGAAFPDTQRKFPIIALGSSCKVNGDRHVMYLYRFDAERDLYLSWWDYGWNNVYDRFLAVRK